MSRNASEIDVAWRDALRLSCPSLPCVESLSSSVDCLYSSVEASLSIQERLSGILSTKADKDLCITGGSSPMNS